MPEGSLVLRDTELVELLADEPELLALSDAYAATQRDHWTHTRSLKRLIRATVVAAAAAAIAIPAAAFADQIGSLVGLYDSGTPVPTTALPDYQVSGLAHVQGFDTGAVRVVGRRAGLTFYAAKNAQGHLCFAIGVAATPSIDALTCQHSRTAFPSASQPIADFSGVNSDGTIVTQLAGFATDNVARVAVLASDGSPIASVPVIDNIYGGDELPSISASAIVAYDSAGNVLFRRNLTVPVPQPAVPTSTPP